MLQALIHHLYVEKLLHILPIESTYNTYEEVERDQFFISIRSIIINIAVSRDINVVIEQTLDLIDDHILKDKNSNNNGKSDTTIISDSLPDGSIHSILVLIRLISSIMEYYWPYIDSLCESNQYDDNDFDINSDSLMGISRPVKRITLKKQPAILNDQLTFRLLNTLIKVKFNTRTLEILGNLSNFLSFNNNPVAFSTILPKYQEFIKRKNVFPMAKLMDLTISHIFKFIAASNPNEYFKYIRKYIQEPLLHQNLQNELSVVQYIELLSYAFLVESNVFQFLELFRYLFRSLTHTIFQHLLMLYTSKSFLFWIMSRPNEYCDLFKKLSIYMNKPDSKGKPFFGFISSLFDEIYSKFNITNILTSTQNLVPSTYVKSFTDVSSVMNQQQPHSPHSPHPQQSQSNAHPLHHSSSRNFESNTITSPLSTASFSISMNNQSQYSIDSSVNLSESSSLSSSAFNLSSHSDLTRRSSLPELEQFVQSNSLDTHNTSATSPDIYSMYLSSHAASNKNDPSPLKNLQKSANNHNNNNNNDSRNNSILSTNDKYINIRKKSHLQETLHLEGILALFSHFDENEPLTHTSPLRFLMILTLFDTELYSEINSESFRNLIDTEIIENKLYYKKDKSDKDKHHSTDHGNNNSDRLKHHHKNTLANGFKKLSMLSSNKKRSTKFITLLIKNINGTLTSSDTSLIDSVRVALVFFCLTSSASLVDDNLSSVIFAKRSIPMLGVNLNVGENWDNSVIPNSTLVACLSKNIWNLNQFRIKYFCAVMQSEPLYFIEKLNIKKLTIMSDLSKLNLYTESLKIFFRLPGSIQVRKLIASNTSELLQNLLCAAADIVLEDYPNLDEKTNNFVDSIVDGKVFEIFGNLKTFSSGTPSISSSMRAESPFADMASPNSPLKTDSLDNDVSTEWSQQSTFSPSASINSPQLSALPMARSKSNNMQSRLLPENLHLVAPRASTPTNNNKTRISLLSSPEYEDSPPQSISARLMTVSTSTPASSRNIKIQARTPNRYKNENDEHISRNSQLKATLSPDNKFSIGDNEDGVYAKKIMINIFTMFNKLLPLYILPHDSESGSVWIFEDFKNIMKPIFIAIIISDDALEKNAQSFMDSLVEHVKEFSSDTAAITVNGYILISSYTVCLFCMGLFDLDVSDSKVRIIINIVTKYLKLRSYLISLSSEQPLLDSAIDADKETFPLLLGTIGRALIISLCSCDQVVQNSLREIYQELDNIIVFHENNVEKLHPDWLGNLPFQKMMAENDNLATTSGSLAFQRRVRRGLLKYTKNLDSILLDGICVMFRKWKDFTRYNRKLNQQEWANFRSLSGILAPISGVLFLGYVAPDNITNPRFDDWIWHLRKDFDFFIFKQCQWLNNPDLIIRENARDVISVELHPLSFKVLFEHLRGRVEEINTLDLSLPQNELAYVLLEQLIIILRTILRRDDSEKVMVLFSIEIFELIDQLTFLVEQMPNNVPKYFKAVIQMSKMFKAIEHSEVSLAIKNHYILKNKWLKFVVRWFKLTIAREYDIENLRKPHREMDLQRCDLDYLYVDAAIESAKAISYLTKNLPLQIAAASTEEEIKRSKFVIFGNYFNILLKGLKKSMNNEQLPVSLKHKMNMLNENIILSLTNLSNANIDTSLHFTLPMGYSKNKSIRIAFLKLFINILSSLQVQKKKIESERLKAMDDLLQFAIDNPQLTYVVANTCPAQDLDSYATVVVNGLETRNAAHIIVSQLVTDEIKNASRPTDILRRNSCATRALSLLSKYKGAEYLIGTLRPVLQEYLDNKDYFEIEKMQPTDPNYEVQIELFKKYMTKILDAVCNSIPAFPPEFFYISQTIYSEVKEKFPDYAYIAVGSFVFLRLICPALVNPESENIVQISSSHENKPLITLAKAIQNLANGSENMAKWPSLNSQPDFLSECSSKIFNFLHEICRHDRNPRIIIRKDGPSQPFEFNFLHQMLLTQEIEIRKRLLKGLKSTDDFSFFRKTLFLLDDIFGRLGEPKMESSHEIPEFVRLNSDKYPKLYEYMNRQAFRKHQDSKDDMHLVHESLTSDGVPIVSFMIGRELTDGNDIEAHIYKLLKIYGRIWTVKHYFVLDCTQYDGKIFDLRKVITILNTTIPDIAVENCSGYYLLNVNEYFLRDWDTFFEHKNIYVERKVPLHFINSNSDGAVIKNLRIGGEGFDVWEDVRVSLHDLSMKNNETNNLVPVSLKIGNKYFQVLQEVPTKMLIKQTGETVEFKINEVQQLFNVTSVHVSSEPTPGLSGEFTINVYSHESFIFYSSKYLEIVKMFHYAKAREESGFNTDVVTTESESNMTTKETKETRDLICHLFLVILMGFFHDDNVVKNLSYNLIAEAEKAFHLDFGTHFHQTPELYVPRNITTFLYTMTKTLAVRHPELTGGVWKYILEGMCNAIIPKEYIPQTAYALALWIPDLYDYVYQADKEEGAENISRIFRNLIKLTVNEPSFTTTFLHELWFPIGADGRLSQFLVTEVVNHALERDSEGHDWERISSILCSFPTVEVASIIIKRIFTIVESFLPSLQLETSTQSWAELKILVNIALFTFFDSPFITNMFLPEVLFIVSLLIDIEPADLKTSLHELLMNVCSSLAVDDGLSEEKKKSIEKITDKFCTQKLNYLSGFHPHKGNMMTNISTSSFNSKFGILESFIDNIFDLMDCVSPSESTQWKSKYRKLLTDAVFTNSSFLSARATMILGIVGKKYTSEALCKNLLFETMRIASLPLESDESVFSMVSHCFAFSSMVDGLDPSSNLVKELFWLSLTLVDPYNAAVYEGALLLMCKSLNRIYAAGYEKSEDMHDTVGILLDARKYSAGIYAPLDQKYDIAWNRETFPHIITTIIECAYSIPTIRTIAITCLKTIFVNAYKEGKQLHRDACYGNYVFLLYLVTNSKEFNSVLEEVGFTGELVPISKEYQVPAQLLEWLSSDLFTSNTSLYQGSVMFINSSVDGPTKLRFSLIMRYLLLSNPVCLFRFYATVEPKIKKLVLNNLSECVPVLFEIVSQIVKYEEYDDIQEYNADNLKNINNRGLQIVTGLHKSPLFMNNGNITSSEDPQLIYERRRTIILAISRIIFI